MVSSTTAHGCNWLVARMPNTDIMFMSSAFFADSRSLLQVENSSGDQSQPQVEHTEGLQSSARDPFAPDSTAHTGSPAALALLAAKAAILCMSGANTHFLSCASLCHTAWVSADDEAITVILLHSFDAQGTVRTLQLRGFAGWLQLALSFRSDLSC